MNVIKSLIGSLVGAAIATVIYYFAKPQLESFYLWFPVLAGALTGIVAGTLGGSSRTKGERLLSGAVSAFVAAITMFGADVVLSRIESAELGKKFPVKKMEQSAAEKKEMAKSDGDPVETDSKADEKTTEDVAKVDEPKGESSDEKQLASDSKVNATEAERGSIENPGQPVSTPEQREMGAQMIAEMERKRKINDWLQLILPGVGILLAYQFARGFRNNPAEK